MIFMTFESEGHANWPLLLQIDVVGDWNGFKKPISK
jgi:hypothetical protein